MPDTQEADSAIDARPDAIPSESQENGGAPQTMADLDSQAATAAKGFGVCSMLNCRGACWCIGAQFDSVLYVALCTCIRERL